MTRSRKSATSLEHVVDELAELRALWMDPVVMSRHLAQMLAERGGTV